MSSRNMLMQLLKHMKKKKAGTIKTGKNAFFFRRIVTVMVLPVQFIRRALTSAVNSSVTGW